MRPVEIIKKNYLRNFLCLLLLVLLVSTAATSIVLHFNIHRPLNTHYSAILSILSDLKETLLIKTLKINAIFSFLAAIGLLFIGIIYTHRIAGPLYRIKSAAKAIGEGNLETKIQLRSKDVIHHFATSLNSMTESYRDRISVLSGSLDQLRESITEIKSLTDDNKETDSTLEKIRDKNIEIHSQIDSMKL
jgi:methyl-accepting chemotaxis protein